MPALTADTIAEAAMAPASAAVDGLSASAVKIGEQLESLRAVQGANAVSGTNRAGGPRSGWNMTRPARAVTEGP